MKYVKRGALDCFTVVACEKRAAFGACFAVGYEKQAAFWGCYGVGGGKCGALDCFTVVVYTNRGAFSCPYVGAYCIRPTKWPRRGQECASTIDHLDHSPHKWDAGGAYAIRPYTAT